MLTNVVLNLRLKKGNGGLSGIAGDESSSPLRTNKSPSEIPYGKNWLRGILQTLLLINSNKVLKITINCIFLFLSNSYNS